MLLNLYKKDMITQKQTEETTGKQEIKINKEISVKHQFN